MAGGIRVTVSMDTKAWEAGVARLTSLLYTYTGNASLDAAEAVQKQTRVLLNEKSHSSLEWAGPAGSPPSRVWGNLSASISTARVGFTAAIVGPTAGYGRSGDYARIQELGGTMHGHPVMQFYKWGAGGAVHKWRLQIVRLAPRPYLAPATEDAIADGSIRDAYERWWAQAIEQV